MKSKISWAIASILMVISLLLVSCGSKGPATTAASEKPKYGGTATIVFPNDLFVFSPHALPGRFLDDNHLGFVYEQYTNLNWALGSAGTGETHYGELGHTCVTNWKQVIGYLAESFETPTIGVWILNIRKGVHYGLNPKMEASRLVNGREMTADDVAWVLNERKTNPNDYLGVQKGLSQNMVIEKTGPWQVTVKTPVDAGVAYSFIMGGGGAGSAQYVPEVLQKYGSTNDWHQMVGTGPYMIDDRIEGSSTTFIRNPNYWQKNPVGPGKGDQLPYPDQIKVLAVPDFSSRLALLRTGKGDRVEGLAREDFNSLRATNPELKYHRYLPIPGVISLRLDNDKLPYKDKRVRQALMLAFDYNSMVKDFYKGEAVALATPVEPIKGNEDVYWPIETLPEAARTLFTYDPAKAKQLLAEAGYPTGFKAKVVVKALTPDVDEAEIWKSMWAKVGVDLEILVTDAGTYTSIWQKRAYEEMEFQNQTDWTALSARYSFAWASGAGGADSLANVPRGKEPVLTKAFNEMQTKLWLDPVGANKIIHDLVPYVVENAFDIPRAVPYTYRFWQPWLKNYDGESWTKYWVPYIWVDQDLRQKLTGTR